MEDERREGMRPPAAGELGKKASRQRKQPVQRSRDGKESAGNLDLSFLICKLAAVALAACRGCRCHCQDYYYPSVYE